MKQYELRLILTDQYELWFILIGGNIEHQVGVGPARAPSRS
jgi:hypothetical protein